MKVLFVNPIIYTPENAQIPKVETIDDTMSYDLCRAFQRAGVDITLAAAEEWHPIKEDRFPFPILWLKSSFKQLFPIHRIPVNLGLIRHLRTHRYDMVITSEVFSMDTLLCSLFARKRTIIWHEMAKHNNMGGGMLSRIWYNVIPRLFMRSIPVVARSEQARAFISRYCRRVNHAVIEHGVDLETFALAERKTNSFCVVSQLIPRKRIDGIIRIFSDYHGMHDSECRLVVIGEGVERASLERLTTDLGVNDVVEFTGRLGHHELQHTLAEAKAMLVNTEKDNSMISIVEAIASGTPVVTTTVPLNAATIQSKRLGLAKDGWDADDLALIDRHLDEYTANCRAYRDFLSTDYKVQQFLDIYESEIR